MELFDWEKMAILICAVLLSISSALVVVLCITYFFISTVKRDLDRQGAQTYNLRQLKYYAPALKLIFLKLTKLSYAQVATLTNTALSAGQIDLRFEGDLIKLNGEVIPLEPSKNDPSALLAIDGILKALNDTSDNLAYYLSLGTVVDQYVSQTPLDFFQHISGIAHTVLNEKYTVRITLDRYGMIVSKHDLERLLCKQTLKVVEIYQGRPGSIKGVLPNPELKPQIRRWGTV